MKELIFKILALRRYLNQHLALNLAAGFVIGSLTFQYGTLGIILLSIWCVINIRLSLVFIAISVLTGFLYTQISLESLHKEDTDLINSKSFTVEVISKPSQKDFNLEQIVRVYGLKSNAIATLPKYSNLTVGDVIRITGSIKKTDLNSSYGKFLMSQKILYRIEASNFQLVKHKNSLSSFGYKVNQKFTKIGNSYLSEPHSSLFNGITIGQDNFNKDFTNKVKLSGLSHILAVSGFNLLLSFNLLLALSSKISRPKIIGISSIFIFMYLLIVGLDNLTAFRAFIVILIFLSSTLLGRKISQTNVLIYSLVVLVLIYPFYLSNISIQLSVAAGLGIIYIKPGVSKRLKRLIKNSITLDLIATSLAAYLATLPIITFAFGESSIAGLVTNVIVLPFIPIITILGICIQIVSLANIEVINRTLMLIIQPALYYISSVIEISSKINLPLVNSKSILLPYLVSGIALYILKPKNE